MMKVQQGLNRVAAILTSLREIDEAMPSQMAHSFIVIAMRPGITMQQLSEEVGISQSSCSRNVAALSKHHRLGKEGYDLVEAVEDPAERRRKIMFLTIKGKDRVRKVLKALEPDMVIDDLRLPTAKEYLSGAYKRALQSVE